MQVGGVKIKKTAAALPCREIQESAKTSPQSSAPPHPSPCGLSWHRSCWSSLGRAKGAAGGAEQRIRHEPDPTHTPSPLSVKALTPLCTTHSGNHTRAAQCAWRSAQPRSALPHIPCSSSRLRLNTSTSSPRPAFPSSPSTSPNTPPRLSLSSP